MGIPNRATARQNGRHPGGSGGREGRAREADGRGHGVLGRDDRACPPESSGKRLVTDDFMDAGDGGLDPIDASGGAGLDPVTVVNDDGSTSYVFDLSATVPGFDTVD